MKQRRCCIQGCGATDKDAPDRKFHLFPLEEGPRANWIATIGMLNNQIVVPSKKTFVCSSHFKAEDYPTGGRKLLRNAVPSVFIVSTVEQVSNNEEMVENADEHLVEIGSGSFENTAMDVSEIPQASSPCASGSFSFLAVASTSTPAVSSKRRRKLDYTTERFNDYVNDHSSEVAMSLEVSPSGKTILESCVTVGESQLNLSYDSLKDLDSPTATPIHVTKKKLTSALTELNVNVFRITRFVNDDDSVRHYTGFPSYQALYAFFEFLCPEVRELHYVGRKGNDSGENYMLYRKRGPDRRLSPLDELFLTLIRLRQNPSEKMLGDLFQIDQSYVSRVTNTFVIFLSDRLASLPIWPSSEWVKENMPEEYKQVFPDCRVICDCTEFFIEKPSASLAQRETFSSYKHHNTAKILVVIEPGGSITYVSPLYSGRVSDKNIIVHCGLLDMLEPGDAVMVDKGFEIEKHCQERGLKLLIPSFKRGNSQFTVEEVAGSRKISSIRVHSERAIRRIKEFKILRGIIPITLCPMLPHIVKVCSYLPGLTGSIFAGLGNDEAGED